MFVHPRSMTNILCSDFHTVIFQIFDGNNDVDSTVTNSFSPALNTRFIRLTVEDAQTHSVYIDTACMRFELYGCPYI